MTAELTTEATVSIREKIAQLIQDGNTHDQILAELKITNGTLKFHCLHIAKEIGSTKSSVEGLERRYRRNNRRVAA